MYFKFIFGFISLLYNGVQSKEYCNGELFRPSCADGQVIIMKSALYGRLKIGRCVHLDLGYLGCSSDVLALMDETCSGKQSCEILATDSHIEVSDGCIREVQRYLEVEFECKSVADISRQCPSSEIDLMTDDSFITGSDLYLCSQSNSRKLRITAKEGQNLNISLVSFSTSKPEIYGSVKDPSSGKDIIIGSGTRNQHVVNSLDNVVDITLQSERDSDSFLLRFKVASCPNIAPPNGAWMTRNGDTMEIGCHTGDKSWAMKCVDNQWTGAVGQCGSGPEEKSEEPKQLENDEDTNVSINVLMFGGSSVVILVSAIIFLVGVCILRRKMQYTERNTSYGLNANYPKGTGANMQDMTNLLAQGTTISQNPNQHSSSVEGYKSFQMPDRSLPQNDTTKLPPAYTMYANTNGPDKSGSVQYFGLEDPQQGPA